MLRTNRTPSHVEGGRGGIEMREGMRGEGGRIIQHVLQCVACGSVAVGGYLHGSPEPCGSQHGLSGNRAP